MNKWCFAGFWCPVVFLTLRKAFNRRNNWVSKARHNFFVSLEKTIGFLMRLSGKKKRESLVNSFGQTEWVSDPVNRFVLFGTKHRFVLLAIIRLACKRLLCHQDLIFFIGSIFWFANYLVRVSIISFKKNCTIECKILDGFECDCSKL